MDKEELIFNDLMSLYEQVPDNKKKLCAGLIREAARLKVSLDELWEDIQQNGTTEIDSKGNEKERVNSAIFTSRDKSYRACIRHLDSLLPSSTSKSSGFSKLDDDEEDEDGDS